MAARRAEAAAVGGVAGMDDYLRKPIKADELFAMLERWTAARRPAD